MNKILIILLLLSCAVWGQVVRSIEFKNLTRVSPVVANAIVDMSIGAPLDTNKLNAVIKEFFSLGYFEDIKVEQNGGNLVFYFVEKPVIVNIQMKGYKNRKEDIQTVLDMIGIQKGAIYSSNTITKAKKELKAMLRAEGYINNVVEIEVEKIKKFLISLNIIVNKGDEIVITQANYKGAQEFDDDEFDDVLANKEVEMFPWFFGQNDGILQAEQLQYEDMRLKELYLEHGFLDANISKVVADINYNTIEAKLGYDISEGVQYKVGDIMIYMDKQVKDPDKIIAELKLEKGDIFNIKNLRKDIEFIKLEVGEGGYAFVKVAYNLRKDGDIVNINFNVTVGEKVYINDVLIDGNTRTLDRVIRRDLYLGPKELFSLRDIKDSENALRRTGFFDSVEIKQQRVSKEKMDLIVKVKEAKTGTLMFGGGYGSYNGLSINASIDDRNTFGSSKKFGLSLAKSKFSQSATVSLYNPAINDSQYNGSTSLYHSDSTIEYSDDELEITRDGGTLGIGKKLSRYTRTGLLYRLEHVTEAHTVLIEDDKDYVTSSITPYIKYNNTDDYYVPRGGIDTGLSVEYAGVGGDSKYVRTSTSFKTYFGLEKYIDYDMVLRYKFNIRTIDDLGEIHEGDSYVLGGVSTVRGYRYAAFKSLDRENHPYTRVASTTAGASFPLVPSAKLRWAIFADAGTIGEKDFNDLQKYGYGVAIEWFSMVGPIRLIWAEAIDPDPDDDTENFEFSLGSKF